MEPRIPLLTEVCSSHGFAIVPQKVDTVHMVNNMLYFRIPVENSLLKLQIYQMMSVTQDLLPVARGWCNDCDSQFAFQCLQSRTVI